MNPLSSTRTHPVVSGRRAGESSCGPRSSTRATFDFSVGPVLVGSIVDAAELSPASSTSRLATAPLTIQVQGSPDHMANSFSSESCVEPPNPVNPTIPLCLREQLAPWMALWGVLAVLALGNFVVGGHPVTAWYPAVYVAMSLLALPLGLVISGAQMAMLVHDIGECVQDTLPSVSSSESHYPSTDGRLRYIQSIIRRGLHGETCRASDTDPLSFVRQEIAQWDTKQDGYVVVDQTGIILWVNAAFYHHFGYREQDLDQVNVRALMPSPYKHQHDQFLRRHISTGTRCILGRERLVPVLHKDGTRSIVPMLVEDRTEAAGKGQRIFVGRFRLNMEDDVLQKMRSQLLAEGADVERVCHLLDVSRDGAVVISADGLIIYSNEAFSDLFEWKADEVKGQNVKMLMTDLFARRHDGFLLQYQLRAQRSQQQYGLWPASQLVGSGRDVVGKTKNGSTIRLFLVLHRLDRASCLAKDCLFLGKMIPVPTALASDTGSESVGTGSSPPSPMVAPGDMARSSSAMIHREPRMKTVPVSLPVKRRCSIVMVQVTTTLVDVPREVQRTCAALTHILEGCSQYAGAVYSVIGDRGIVTFNAMPPTNSSHRNSAAAYITGFLSDCCSFSFNVAATCGECHVAHWGHRDVLVGPPLDMCSALLLIARDAQVSRAVIDASLYEEICYSYHCRMINVLTLHPNQPQSITMNIYEMLNTREVALDDWMYEVADAQLTPHFLHQWEECWEYLSAPGRSPNYTDALRCLASHVMVKPEDNTAFWLQEVLRRKKMVNTAPSERLETVGNLTCTIRYYLGAI